MVDQLLKVLRNQVDFCAFRERAFEAMKSDSQTKVKLMDKGKHQDNDAPKKEATPEWVIDLMSSVKRLEQKVDNTMDEVDALKVERVSFAGFGTVHFIRCHHHWSLPWSSRERICSNHRYKGGLSCVPFREEGYQSIYCE